MSFFNELKRRNVFRVGIAYLVVAWLAMQVADVVLNNVEAPGWVFHVIVLALGIGFMLALFFAWAFELTPEGLKKEKDVDRTQSITAKTGRKLDFAIIGLLALTVVYLLWDKLGTAPATAPPEEIAAVEAPVVETATKSIAVLPFNNMSDDASNEYFADGISEEILNALARVKGLKVAGRTSSFAFKGRNEDLRLIGATLGVNHILEGSVRKAGNTVRITAQLVQVSDGFHLWSDTYDRELTDIFAIQDEIAGAILEKLKAELIGGEQVASTRTDTIAYEKYLLAKQRIYSRNTPEIEIAAKLLEEVVNLDPDFAPGWAQRGIVTMLLSDQNYGTIPNSDAVDQAKSYIDRAMEIDDGVAEAWAGLGLTYTQSYSAEQRRQGIEPLERALEINPSLINASNWLQNNLASLDRFREARAILEDMFERDPLYRPAISNLIFSYARTGELEKAEAALDRVRPFLKDEPSLASFEAQIRLWAGEYAEALPFAEFAVERMPLDQNFLATLGFALLNLNEYERILPLEVSNPFTKVISLYRLGRVEEATMLAREFSGTDPSYLLNILVSNGEFTSAVELVEERWPELEAFDAFYGGFFGFGYYNMLLVAKAYQETDNPEKFDQAMKMVRDEHDRQIAQGAGTFFFWVGEAGYWTLANDLQKAIDFLEKAVAQGWTGTPRISDSQTLLKPLEGDPRFEALQDQALQHLNRERLETGLEPLEAGYSL